MNIKDEQFCRFLTDKDWQVIFRLTIDNKEVTATSTLWAELCKNSNYKFSEVMEAVISSIGFNETQYSNSEEVRAKKEKV